MSIEKKITMEELNKLFPTGISTRAMEIIEDPEVPPKKVREHLEQEATIEAGKALETIAPIEVLTLIVNRAFEYATAVQWLATMIQSSEANPMDRKLAKRVTEAEGEIAVKEAAFLELFINQLSGAVENPVKSVQLVDQIMPLVRMLKKDEG